MQKRRQSEKGFSLIELVVVMAIVGVLMMVGVPQVQNYIAKAKRTEMRTNLAQLYASEKSFHSEYSTYLADLQYVGYRPEGTLNYYYGFTEAGSATVPDQLSGTAGTQAVVWNTKVNDYCAPLANRNSSPDTPCFHNPSAEAAQIEGGGPMTPLGLASWRLLRVLLSMMPFPICGRSITGNFFAISMMA